MRESPGLTQGCLGKATESGWLQWTGQWPGEERARPGGPVAEGSASALLRQVLEQTAWPCRLEKEEIKRQRQPRRGEVQGGAEATQGGGGCGAGESWPSRKAPGSWHPGFPLRGRPHMCLPWVEGAWRPSMSCLSARLLPGTSQEARRGRQTAQGAPGHARPQAEHLEPCPPAGAADLRSELAVRGPPPAAPSSGCSPTTPLRGRARL